MEGSEFDQIEFFRAISSTRALLIGRQALIILGLPMVTADYDFWLHIDDMDAFNAAADPFGLAPNREPAEARRVGRYALENDEHVDVLISRTLTTRDATETLSFTDAWERRQIVEISPGVSVAIPTIEDLIVTKRVAERTKDLADIRLLEALRSKS